MKRNRPRITPRWCKNAKIAMIEADISTGELAAALNFTPEYMSAILNGRVMTYTAIDKVSDYLKISNQYIY